MICLSIFLFGMLIKQRSISIADINPQTEYIQVAGVLLNVEVIGDKRAKRLVAQLKDKTGILELIWFQGISWVQKICSRAILSGVWKSWFFSKTGHRSFTRKWNSGHRKNKKEKVFWNLFIQLRKN